MTMLAISASAIAARFLFARRIDQYVLVVLLPAGKSLLQPDARLPAAGGDGDLLQRFQHFRIHLRLRRALQVVPCRVAAACHQQQADQQQAAGRTQARRAAPGISRSTKR